MRALSDVPIRKRGRPKGLAPKAQAISCGAETLYTDFFNDPFEDHHCLPLPGTAVSVLRANACSGSGARAGDNTVSAVLKL